MSVKTYDENQNDPLPMRRNIKDSVFSNLFSQPRYTLELYRALHPEDADVCEDDIRIVTLQHVMTCGQYNDLGFTVGDRLLLLVEAQSTWSPNIVLRALLYAAETIKRYASEHDLDLYGSKPVQIPKPELYVVYTGPRKRVPSSLTISEVLFGGEPCGIDARVKVLRGDGEDIIAEYVDLTDTVDEHRLKLGPTEEAVRAAIDDCIRRGVLADYLLSHREEVVGIMITLYDEEEVLRIHYAALKREARELGLALGKEQGLAEGLEQGLAEGLEQGMAEGLEQGMAEGMAQGIAEGHAQGMAQGLAEGHAQGMAQGMAQGLAEGHAQGIAQGIAQGTSRGVVETCRALGATKEAAADLLAKQLGITPEEALAEVESIW